MTAKYYYENFDDLITMLDTRPAGKLEVLIGTDGNTADVPPNLLVAAASKSRALVVWIKDKIQAGELIIKASGKTDLPQGEKLKDESVKIRVYKDNNGILMAQSLHDSLMPDAQAVVFRAHIPIGSAMGELLFTDMTPQEAQNFALKDIEKVMMALANEGTRIGLADTDEEYYLLQFSLHPIVDKKEKNRIAKKLGEAVAANGGWMNHIIIPVAPYTYRYDMAIKNVDATRQAIARVLKQYGQTTDFTFEKNDF
jgi:hypothetical protein